VTRPLLAALAGLAALALVACGEREEPGLPPTPTSQSLTLVLDYLPNADHAGVYVAQGRGLFRRAGLEVELETPSDPAAPLRLVAARRADLAISYQPELLLARQQGLPVQSVGALVQVPLTSLMSVGRDAIGDPRELRGATVGTAGISYQSAYLRTILDRAGVPRDSVRQVDVGFNLVPTMLSGRVDATLGAFWNVEGVELERRGRRPRIIRMERVGVPTYAELVLVAREETVRNEGAKLRRFLQALTQGHVALRADPRGAIEPLLRANPDLDRELVLAQVRATLPTFFPRREERPFGWQEPAEWQAYARWMADNRLLREPRVADRAFTNEFLPGEGP
jgi:putative hydroxymethylpyrimidine transport system substrate-binding protein